MLAAPHICRKSRIQTFSALQPTRDTKIAGIIEKALNELENYLAFYTFASRH